MLAPLTRWHIQNYKEANKMIHVEFWNISKYVSHQMSQNLQGMMQCTKRRARLWQGTASRKLSFQSPEIWDWEGKGQNTPKTKQTEMFSATIYLKGEVKWQKTRVQWSKKEHSGIPRASLTSPGWDKVGVLSITRHCQQNKSQTLIVIHTKCNKSRVKGTMQNNQEGLSPLALPNAFPCTFGNTGNVHEFISIPAWCW